jgi:hypothetical protein
LILSKKPPPDNEDDAAWFKKLFDKRDDIYIYVVRIYCFNQTK